MNALIPFSVPFLPIFRLDRPGFDSRRFVTKCTILTQNTELYVLTGLSAIKASKFSEVDLRAAASHGNWKNPWHIISSGS